MILTGKTAIVTGASRGIGKAIAMKLGKMGANIVLNASVTSKDIDETQRELEGAGISTVVSRANVHAGDQIEAMFKTAIDAFGKVDILVNNAGITKDMPMIKMTEKDWDDVIDTNLKGAFLCTKAATKIMMKQRSGKIINISSIVGVIGNQGQANYSASKAGLIGLTKSTAKEFATRGVTCNVIAPGFIETKMTDSLSDALKESYLNSIPLRRLGTPDDVANVVAFLASPESDYITGQLICVDGGLVMY